MQEHEEDSKNGQQENFHVHASASAVEPFEIGFVKLIPGVNGMNGMNGLRNEMDEVK